MVRMFEITCEEAVICKFLWTRVKFFVPLVLTEHDLTMCEQMDSCVVTMVIMKC